MDREELHGVLGGKVLWCDQKLLRDGSARLRKLSDPELETWLLRSFSFLSSAQIQENEVNSKVPLTVSSTWITRPRGYGRAGIFSTEAGLFDVKGIGVSHGKIPSRQMYRTGLISIVEAILEVATEKQAAVALQGKYDCIQSVALIALPFSIHDLNVPNATAPAALLVRQFAPRPSWMPQKTYSIAELSRLNLDIELELRKSGLTSCHPARQIKVKRRGGRVFLQSGVRLRSELKDALRSMVQNELKMEVPLVFDVSNIEIAFRPETGSFKPHVVDFGGYRSQDRFDQHLLTFNVSSTTGTAEVEIVRSDSPAFVASRCRRAGFSAFYQPSADESSFDYFGVELDARNATSAFVRATQIAQAMLDGMQDQNNLQSFFDWACTGEMPRGGSAG